MSRGGVSIIEQLEEAPPCPRGVDPCCRRCSNDLATDAIRDSDGDFDVDFAIRGTGGTSGSIAARHQAAKCSGVQSSTEHGTRIDSAAQCRRHPVTRSLYRVDRSCWLMCQWTERYAAKESPGGAKSGHMACGAWRW